MPRFLVRYYETTSYDFEVEAEDEEDARFKTGPLYDNSKPEDAAYTEYSDTVVYQKASPGCWEPVS